MKHNTIGIIFDFDDTLTHDSTTAFIESVGIDSNEFWYESVNTLVSEGWDRILAYLFRLIEFSRLKHPNDRITKKILSDFGKSIILFKGVTTIFNRLNKFASDINPHINVEYYLISSGIAEIIKSTKIAKFFTDIQACEYYFNKNGEIHFPMKIVGFSEKTRYLFQISKGSVNLNNNSVYFDVNKKVAPDSYRIPFHQMIYIGDGLTDIPCFTIIKRYGGYAIGVYDITSKKRMQNAWEFIKDDRVSNLVPAIYTKGSAIESSLYMAIANIINNL